MADKDPDEVDDIVEQKNQVSKHEDYEYDTLMSMLNVSVSKHLLDESFTLVWSNKYYYQLIGYDQPEYETLFHNRPDIYYPYHHYEDEHKKLTETVIDALQRGAKGFNMITRLPIKGNRHIWVRMVATFTDEYINGYQVSYTAMTDIGDLVRIEKEQDITTRNIPGFVARFLFRKNGQVDVLDANDGFRAFFGEELNSPKFQELFQTNWNDNLAIIIPQLKNVWEKKSVKCLLRLKDKNGRPSWLQVQGDYADMFGDEPVYLLVYIDVSDLTDLREMQEKLTIQAERLNKALIEAESANRAKSDFLSRMSHDIRTPMNAIVGMTEIASTNLDNPAKVRDCLRKITISSQHLLGLINDVLDMSKIESGKMSLREDPLYLAELMESVVQIIQPMVKAKKQDFCIRLRRLEHEHFICDSLRLRQCFINILSNASKYTPDGGSITMDIDEEPSEAGDIARLIFTFTDTGIGMKSDFIEHIFDAFTRELDCRVDKAEGSGLGMAITKRIVDMMGGKITVESELGEGSTFIVELPLGVDSSIGADDTLPGLRILVVDDDDLMCECTTQLLNDCGAKAVWVSSGEAAVAKIQEAHQDDCDFDAMILDWKMPGSDGLKTVESIRGTLNSNIPVLLVSAYDWAEVEPQARALGVNGFLQKPLFRSTLCRGIRKVLGREGNAAPVRGSEISYDFTGRHILLVEDNELNAEIAVELLTKIGAQVTCASNGVIGVETFESSPEGYFDLILMDIQMPVMDGLQASWTIRKSLRKDAKSVPILAMTADAFAEDIAASKEAGMNGHLTKPLDFAAMKREISMFLNRMN